MNRLSGRWTAGRRSLGWLAITSFLLFAPYLVVLNTDTQRCGLNKISLLFVLIAFLAGMSSRMVYGAGSLFLLFVNAVYIHIKYHWGMEMSGSRLEAAMSGEPSEALEYARIYFGTPELWTFAYGVLMVYCLFRLFRSEPVRPRLRIGAFALLLPASAALLFFHESASSFPPVYLTAGVFEARAHLREIADRAALVRSGAGETRTCSEDYGKIVVVIGESANRNHMSLYGYPERTTPFLDSLKPWRFNGLAASNQTRYSIPLLLTHAKVNDFEAFFKTPSLVSELKSCGYETWWISNQGALGVNETYVTSIAKEADSIRFLSSLDYVQVGYDGRIVDTVAKYNAAGRRQAFFLHLRGSHFDYRERYPHGYSLKPGNDVVERYDNSVHYTDSVLSGIFGKFDARDMLFVYVSDHGEVVTKNLNGHGFLPGFREEFEIPLVMWSARPERMAALKDLAGERLLNAESFRGMVAYLSGMQETPEASFSTVVQSLSPKNKSDFNDLKYYDTTLTPAGSPR